jgi:hypothetical protein
MERDVKIDNGTSTQTSVAVSREQRETAIHVNWHGTSEVKDLGTYFRNSPDLQKHLDFLQELREEKLR